jgi:hypothetical protein
LERDITLAQKASEAEQAKEGETLEKHKPPDQGMSGMEGEALKSSKKKKLGLQ